MQGYEYDWWMAWQDILVPLGFIILGFFFHSYLVKTNAVAAARRGKVILADAEKEADLIRREADMIVKNAALSAQERVQQEHSKQRQELIELENRIMRRESDFDRKITLLEQKENLLEQRLADTAAEKEKLKGLQAELHHRIEEETRKLQEIADFSRDKAREIIMTRMETELKGDVARLIRHSQNEARMKAEGQAREIISLAIQRYAGEQVGEVTVSHIRLPDDKVKGFIIGKDGRNIKAFEQTTGVNLIVDETPEMVTVSAYDPVRREVARITLEKLIEDGRIQPARIEELYAKTCEEMEDTIRKGGEDALYELGIQGVRPELISTLGRLKFRQSYSQNVLQHSIQTAHIMGMMAAELDLDASIAKRVGIFHDIGKAVDHEVEGGHAVIGGTLLRKYDEDQVIVNAVASHHGDVEGGSIYAFLASAADAITAARPGARADTTDLYIKRLEKLEKIAGTYSGVKKSFAVQAGRELRVMVEPEVISDNDALLLARQIAKQIEDEIKYPGQIKVCVIRETRCIEYAQ